MEDQQLGDRTREEDLSDGELVIVGYPSRHEPLRGEHPPSPPPGLLSEPTQQMDENMVGNGNGDAQAFVIVGYPSPHEPLRGEHPPSPPPGLLAEPTQQMDENMVGNGNGEEQGNRSHTGWQGLLQSAAENKEDSDDDNGPPSLAEDSDDGLEDSDDDCPSMVDSQCAESEGSDSDFDEDERTSFYV
eukprot:Cvel_34582.t1-p1 / transcript=Cvel_34582.t1 / gene=Cvel_34582 / organism=Chromera_velia_CCMP2878 / gene_product=hypothetical protein / transcript_product=hypothetical protein / location=Cvel_scaffold5988:879-1436(-) / protein_length=186 / sequence_SO=supercontig / SO=protein_coding / is_pseudo=false